MDENNEINKAYPIKTMLIGLGSFLIIGIIIGLISIKTNEGLIPIFGVPIGSLVMLSIFKIKLDKEKIIQVTIRSFLGAFAGFLIGFLISTLLSVIIGFIFPSFRDLDQVKAQIIPNIALLIVADAIYGGVIADYLYGRKSVKFFALVCGIAAIPFGILVSLPINIEWIKFNLNLLFIVVSFGTTTGLTIGLHKNRI